MPKLSVSVPYQIPQDEALRRIQAYVAQAKVQYAGKINDLQESWNGYAGSFRASGMGHSASGNVAVNPSIVIVEIALPFAATFIKEKIEAAIRQELTRILT